MMRNDSGFDSFGGEFSLNKSNESPQKLARNNTLQKFDSFESIISASEASVKTHFTGLEDDLDVDDEATEGSFDIPKADQIDWAREDHNDRTENDCESSLNLHNDSLLSQPTTSEILTLESEYYYYDNKTDPDMSPDLFEDTDPTLVTSSPNINVRTQRVSPKDVKLLDKIKQSLSGLCPPSHLTVFHMSVDEMLNKIEQNRHLLSYDNINQCNNDEFQTIFKPWPDILNSRYYGLHYNRNRISEDIEHQSTRYCERYVGAETQSTCTVFKTTPLSPIGRNIKPRWSVKSPGRRLSHLARRRITFSNTSLANTSSRTRQILVDAKKLSAVSNSNNNNETKKISPNSAKMNLAQRLRLASESDSNSVQSNSSNGSNPSYKRVLFQSPDKGNNSNCSLLSRSSLFSPPKTDFLNIFPRKRKTTESSDEQQNSLKIARSISFSSNQSRSSSTKSTTTTTTSSDMLLYKEKLPLAVYDALRLHGINLSDARCKSFASVLARVTKKVFAVLPVKTSDELRRVARYHAHYVIKGKALEEILIESDYVKNKARAPKPTGYVRKEDEENKENILQDKKQIIASIEKRRQQAGAKTKFNGESRIDRIRRVITFDDNRI